MPARPGHVFIGTSGWQYRHWRETFYPLGVAQGKWLEFYAERFATVELNASFYRLPSRETFEKWRVRTPDDFIFAVKMSRYLTHIKKLVEPEEPVERFLKHATGLGDKLGPILVQLPPTLPIDVEGLAHVLSLIPRDLRVAVEFRHDSWFVDDVREVLEKYGAANCWADRGSRPITALWRTTDWGFVRFHQGNGRPWPCYSKEILSNWAQRIDETWGSDGDVYAFFNNDQRACALRDAGLFSKAIAARRLEPTRVAPRRDVTLGDSEERDEPAGRDALW
ncbi:MAG: DUF72 domain-containing protein [Actinomycetota bacterium]